MADFWAGVGRLPWNYYGALLQGCGVWGRLELLPPGSRGSQRSVLHAVRVCGPHPREFRCPSVPFLASLRSTLSPQEVSAHRFRVRECHFRPWFLLVSGLMLHNSWFLFFLPYLVLPFLSPLRGLFGVDLRPQSCTNVNALCIPKHYYIIIHYTYIYIIICIIYILCADGDA